MAAAAKPEKPLSPPAPKRAAASAPGAGPVPFTREGVFAIWSEVVEAGSGESLFLGQALESCQVASVSAPVVRLSLPPEQGVLNGALDRGRSAIERYLQSRLGSQVVIEVGAATAAAPAERPKRMSEASLRAERLAGLRGRDPVLDAAADELDLEIVEESGPDRDRS